VSGGQSTDSGSSNTAGRSDDTVRSREYSSDLRKCDSMSGTEKSRCVSAAKKKHGQM
jgi:hypothetical protein